MDNEIQLESEDKDKDETKASEQPTVAAAESTVRKGRRGLARKKNASILSQDISSTSHNTSVYSSCVSRGFKTILTGEMNSEQEKQPEECDKTVNNAEIVTDVPTTSHNDDVHTVEEELCEQNEQFSDSDIEEIGQEDREVASSINSLRSPTPPPVLEGPTNKKKRMNRKLTTALNTLNKAKGNLHLTPPTPFSKRRGRKHNMRVADVVVTEDVSPVKSEMLLKVRYLSNIHRFQLKLTDPFHTLLHHLSQETGEQEQHLSLFLHDQVLPLSKTPRDVNLTVADIIECHCIKNMKAGVSGNEAITLLIQCSNSKRKSQIKVTKRQPFREVLEMYAEKVGIDASSFHFCFDGEDVGPTDTPLSLDMEDDDILDLLPASASQSHHATMSNTVITLI